VGQILRLLAQKLTINFRGLRVLGILLQVYMSELEYLSPRKYVFAFAFIPAQIFNFWRGVLRANIKEILEDFPQLEEKDIRAAVKYAAKIISTPKPRAAAYLHEIRS